jgi:nucleoid DNA-binding protein
MVATADTQAGKTDLVRGLSEKAGTSLVEAGRLVDAFLDLLLGIVKSQDLKLVGFGAFKRVTLKARQGRNPKTGEAISIPERTVVRFKPSKTLRAVPVKAKRSGNPAKKTGAKENVRGSQAPANRNRK